MQRHAGTRGASTEAAAASLEFVGVAVAAALLVGGTALGLQARAPAVAGAIGGVVGELVEHGTSKRRVRGVHEVRGGGGSGGAKVRVSRDEIRMAPVLDPTALWQREWAGDGSRLGVAASASASACALCVSGEWDRSVEVDPKGGGLLGTVEGSTRVALASVQARAGLRRDLGAAGSVDAAARGRAMVGVEARGEGVVRLDRDGVDAQVEGGAMAGAVARAEARAGVELFGVAIEQSGSAEGWAGAGAKGVLGVHASKGRLQWRVGWGAALGLGGAAEWNGSVDVSKVPAKHRRLARDALRAAVVATRIALPLVP